MRYFVPMLSPESTPGAVVTGKGRVKTHVRRLVWRIDHLRVRVDIEVSAKGEVKETWAVFGKIKFYSYNFELTSSMLKECMEQMFALTDEEADLLAAEWAPILRLAARDGALHGLEWAAKLSNLHEDLPPGG